MAEARTFNFNEVAQPEEKDFQVANKMLFKEGLTQPSHLSMTLAQEM